MKKHAADPSMPAGKLTRIHDALPPPDQLAFPEDTIKVTLLLSKSSVEFFKHRAARHRTKYQRMIRQLVDKYVEHYSH